MFRWFHLIKSQILPQKIKADLYFILSSANSSHSIEEKIEWFESLVSWIKLPASLASVEQKTGHIEAARVRFLLLTFERQPKLKAQASEALQSILLESNSIEFYSSTGLEQQHNFLRELLDRFFSYFIPRYRDANSLKQTFERIFTSDEDYLWFQQLDSKDFKPIVDVLIDIEMLPTFRSKQEDAISTAIFILKTRLGGIVTDVEFMERLPIKDISKSSFFSTQSLSSEWIQACRNEVDTVYPVLESKGLSVDLVYKLRTIQSILTRIEMLIHIHKLLKENRFFSHECFSFILELARLHLQRASLFSFLASSLNLIARKIVERNGITGEHYIAKSRAEYWSMFRSAAGGGLVTVFTTAIKSGIGKLHLPMFFDGLFTSLNYTVSFSFIQVFHFTLATKTPAMTASALAHKLENLSSSERISDFLEEVVCMHRTGFIAVIGNLGFVFPGVMLFDLLWFVLFGNHFYSDSYALKQFQAHSPFESLILWYGIVTGFVLWFASVLGAWLENWFVYRRQFEIMENSISIRRFLGEDRQKKITLFMRQNIAGFGTNIFLGLMLGYIVVFGKFFGLPLEIRHVTLSTGAIGFSLMGVSELKENIFLISSAFGGIFLIGVLNFVVSFSLSLFVATRARDIQLKEFPFLLKLIFFRFKKRPRDFFIP
ncbi:MAG TPA: hypothetical protein PLJ21_00575 [Pseudobdellovibrionaceae bacterium]|nr:hypothetical protein [Pseudobdellovibrionaceae bacterium]